jgi:cytochrome c peroxidase
MTHHVPNKIRALARGYYFILLSLTTLTIGLFLLLAKTTLAADLTPMERLGKRIFFDENLSKPKRQSCASCHDPKTGFSSPNFLVNLFEGVERGAVRRRAGNRKPPTASYATLADNFSVSTRGAPGGGLFFDGRATGEIITEDIFPAHWTVEYRAAMSVNLGTAADQSMAPFLNDVEQNLPSAKALCKRVKRADYAWLFATAWGERIKCSEPVFVDLAHKRIAFAVAVYEASHEVNSFSSKRDIALANDADGQFPLDGLTDEENLGHDLFYLRQNSCARICHSSSTNADGNDPQELYVRTRAGYFNIGTPRNQFNPWYQMDKVRDDDGDIINPLGRHWVDLGVAFRDDDGDGVSDFPDREGRFKTPTVRNVDKRPYEYFPKAFAHNGYFKSLNSIVHFYNTRDMKPTCTDRHGNPQKFVTDRQAMRRGCWPEPEVLSDNIFRCNRPGDCKVELAEGETYETYCDNPENTRDIGNLCLTDEEEDAIVAYMKTLTDTFVVKRRGSRHHKRFGHRHHGSGQRHHFR